MANLMKTNNGLLFYDDFSEKTLMWTLSPSDANCLSFGDNGLQMKHNRRYCSYTITEPSVEEYSCIVKLDHIPFDLNDIAGILVLSSNKEYAECQTYLATGPSELTNSEQFEDDVRNIVNIIMEQNKYIQWSENDENVSNVQKLEVEENNSENIQVNTFKDTIYKYIKINKSKYKYVFYASPDSYSWIEVGNVKFANSGVIGFFIYGTDNKELINNHSHCYFNDFALFASKYLTISGINRNYDMEIIDNNNHILFRTDMIEYQYMLSRSNKECLINTTTLPMPLLNAKIRVYPKGYYENTVFEFELGEKVYGGDIFTLEKDIRLYIDNQEIDQSQLYDIGTFYHGSYYIKMDIHNHEDYILNDVKVKVIKYSEYYGGEEAVGIALYDENHIESELEYKKQVIIDEIRPSEGKSVFIKLIDKPFQDFYKTANSYRFKIIIE